MLTMPLMMGGGSDKIGYLFLSSVDSDNNLLSGVTFGIYSDEHCTELACDSVIIENEPITIELLVGTYYVKVTEVPEDYKLDETVYTVKIVEDETSELTVSIELGTGYLSLSATNSDGAIVYGVILGVYSDEDCTKSVIDPITIEDGAVVVELVVGTYYIKEIEVPEKYVLSDTVYSVNVVSGDTVELVIEIAIYPTLILQCGETPSGLYAGDFWVVVYAPDNKNADSSGCVIAYGSGFLNGIDIDIAEFLSLESPTKGIRLDVGDKIFIYVMEYYNRLTAVTDNGEQVIFNGLVSDTVTNNLVNYLYEITGDTTFILDVSRDSFIIDEEIIQSPGEDVQF